MISASFVKGLRYHKEKSKWKIYIDFILIKSFLKITSNMFLSAGREWFCLSTRYTAIIEVFVACWNILLWHSRPIYFLELVVLKIPSLRFFLFFRPAWDHAYNCIRQNHCNGKIHGKRLEKNHLHLKIMPQNKKQIAAKEKYT